MTISPLVKGSQPVVAKDLLVKKWNPTIEDFNFPDGLPTADDLPDSDDTPVDKEWSRRFPPAREFRSELQELIPGLLKAILMDIWGSRKDWLFSIDMAFHYNPADTSTSLAPDGMLSLGVAEAANENLRSSYVLWQEKVLPLFVMEIASKSAGGEKTRKFEIYQSIGILYYLVYSPLLKRKAKFQLYKLIEGKYILQSSGQQPYWMPEIGLAVGAEKRVYGTNEREWLYWYDENNVRYLTPMEKSVMAAKRADAEAKKAAEETARADAQAKRAAEEMARADAEHQRAETELVARVAAQQEIELLRERMRAAGIDPDSTSAL
jgi:Uma2 family endonuclease